MLVNALMHLINFLIKGLGGILTLIFSLLPDSPFNALSTSPIAKYIGYLNYLIPIQEMLNIGLSWLACIGIYYLYQIGLRWIKAIE